MRKYLVCLLFLLSRIQGFAQVFQYNETFTNSSIRRNDIVFNGQEMAYLTAGSTDPNDPEGYGFLRLTRNLRNQKGYIYCKTPFTSSQGFSIQFEYFTYGGGDNAGADGITFFLFDATAVDNNAFHIGGFGGSLGYAPYELDTVKSNGLAKAYIGIGLDEYGNFKMKKEGRTTGLPVTNYLPPTRNSVTVRGPESSDYTFIANVQTNEGVSAFPIGVGSQRASDATIVGYRKCFIDLEKINGDANNGYLLTVKILEGGPVPKLHTLIDKLEYKYAPPANLMYGLASSTGDSRNIHEIRNVRINSYQPAAPEPPVAVDDKEIDGKSIIAYGKETTPIKVLANDKVETGHSIPFNKVFLNSSLSANGGTITVDPTTGQINYRPKDGYKGPDSFTYYIADDRDLQSSAATVFLTVWQKPLGTPDVISINYGDIITDFDVRANDLDKVNTKFIKATNPKVFDDHPGNFQWKSGLFTYIPVKGPVSDSFSYYIEDENGVRSDTITVTIKINYPPVAVDDPPYYITNNTSFRINPVILNDYDVDADESIQILARRSKLVTAPVHNTGNPDFDTDGYFYYRADNYMGKDGLTYRFADKKLPSNDAKVVFKVYPFPKIGLTKTASFVQNNEGGYDITYKFDVKNLNPTVPDLDAGDQMVLTNVSVLDDISKALNGSNFTIKNFQIFNATNSVLTPNPLFTGKRTNAQDTVSIQLVDRANSYLAVGETVSIELTITVPFKLISAWGIINEAVAKAEFSKLMINKYGDPAKGYEAKATASITLPVLVKPTAKDVNIVKYVDDTEFTEDIIAKYMTVEAGKTIDRSSLNITLSSGTNVTFQIQQDKTVKFTLNGQVGTTEFLYTAKDNKGVESDAKKITIVVKPLPVGVADEFATLTNVPIASMDLKKNDGIGTAGYTVELVDPNTPGVTQNQSGTWRYVPPTDQYGDFSFTYTLKNSDGKKSQPITVSIHVNNPPIGTDANLATAINTPLSINIAGLTRDEDGTVNPDSVKIINPQLQGGTLVADPNNKGYFIFTPGSGFSGTVSFKYTIDDNDPKIKGRSAQKTVTVNIAKGVVATKIGLAKQVASVVKGFDNSFEVKYVFTLKNYGAEVLQNISLTDDIGLAFVNAQFIIKSLTAQGTLAANTAFNGFSSTELLDKANSKLAPGASATVELTLNVQLLDKDGLFVNTAFTEADPASGGPKVKDQSTTGNKPDPADDGDVSPKDPTLVELRFPALFIPEGFSPNNDGTNDLFVIRNSNNRKIAIEIFNRWGNRVYKSTDYQNDWNGRCTEGIYLGQDLPPGTYFYIIGIDNKDKYTGYITLNR